MIGVVTAPGDRRDEDLAEIGRICAEGFDELVLYEMDEYRGRAPGATAHQLERGAMRAGTTWRTVLDVQAAIRDAMRVARPGDVVVIGCASHLDELRDALAGQREIAAVDLAALGIPALPSAVEETTTA